MTTDDQINDYIAGQMEAKRNDLQQLHRIMLALMPKCKLWFLDGKNELGKTVSNPNIGYGFQTMKAAGGKTRDFYQIGISANTTGISVYIMGLQDKNYLVDTYANQIGKASVTGYCIKFKALKDINIEVLQTAIRDGVKQTSN